MEILVMLLGENVAKMLLKYRGYIIVFLVLVIGYFIVKKIGQSFFSKLDKNGKDAQDILNQNGEKPTLTKLQIEDYCDQYYNAASTWAGLNPDEKIMISILLKCKNTSDVLALFEAYGTRDSRTGPGGEFSMPQAALDCFNTSELSQVNDDWKAKGIKARLATSSTGYIVDVSKVSNPDDLDNNPDVLSIPKVGMPVAKYFYLAKKALY